MKLTIKAGALLNAIDQAGMTIGKKADLPFSWMYLEARGDKENQRLLAFATDMVGRTLVKTPATVSKPGSVFIKHGLLAGFLGTVPKEDDIELSLTGEKLSFKCAAGRGNLYLRNTADDTSKAIDSLPYKGKPIFEIKSSILQELISRTEFATTTDRQPILSAVNISAVKGGFVADATDGHIVARAVINDDESPAEKQTITIPSIGLIPLVKLLATHKEESVKIIPGLEEAVLSHNMYFRFSDVIYGTTLLADTYPNIDYLFDTANKVAGPEFIVGMDALKKALSRAEPFSEGGHVILNFEDNTLKIKAEGPTRGKFETSLEGSKPEQKIKVEVSVDMAYIIRAIKDGHSTNLRIITSTDNSRIWMQDDEDEKQTATYLLGCVRQ